MFGFRKRNILFKIQGRERGNLEAFAAVRAQMDANFWALLKQITEREKLPPDSVFDPEQLVFVRAPKKGSSPQ